MQPVLDRPLFTEPGGQFGRAGLLGGQGRDGLPPQAVALAVVLALFVDRVAGVGDLDGLGGVREAESGRDGGGLQGVLLDLSVAAASGVCPTGMSFQARLQPGVQVRLVASHRDQQVRFAGAQVVGRGLRVYRIHGDDDGQVLDLVQKR